MAFCPGCRKATSCGRTLASISRLSSNGTISSRSLPGWTTPPMVLTLSCLMMPCTGDCTVVRLTRSSMARLLAVIFCSSVRTSFSSLKASERNASSDSSILLLISLMPACARGMARVVASSEPRISTALRRKRRISTSEMAPLLTSGCDMFSSCWIRPRLELYCCCLELNSASSWVFCRSCSLRVRCSLCRRSWRELYRASSSSTNCVAFSVISAGISRGRPAASACRRCRRALRAMRSASLSSRLERKRVSSRRNSTSPLFTSCPSRTKISATMPPSRFWMTWILLDGMALPSPMVTSSSTANLAQTRAVSSSKLTSQTVMRARVGESSSRVPSTSGINSVSGFCRHWVTYSRSDWLSSIRAVLQGGRADTALAQGFDHGLFGAVGNDMAVIQYDQAIDQAEHGGAMGDQQQGLVLRPTVQAVAQDLLAGVVHGAGGFIKEQNRRVQEQCAGHQHRPARAAGEQWAALTHGPVEALRMLPGKIADAGHLGDFEHALVADIACAQGQDN